MLALKELVVQTSRDHDPEQANHGSIILPCDLVQNPKLNFFQSLLQFLKDNTFHP